jgi:hypothetical protein
MFWITLATFIAVCIYAGLTYGLVKSSWDANELANKSFYASNRPYLMWTKYLALRILDPSTGKFKEWRIAPVVQNFGKTPATSVIVTLCDPVPRPNVNPPTLKCNIAEAGTPVTTVGPEQESQLFGFPVSEELLNDTITEKQSLWVFGYVKYRSELRPFERLVTRFCHRVAGMPSQPPAVLSQSPAGTPSQPSALQTGWAEVGGLLALGCNDPNWTCIDGACPPDVER